MFARVVLFCWAYLAVVGSAFAAPGVVYGPGLDAADAAVRAKELLGSGDFKVLGSLAELTGPATEAVVIGAAARTCTGKAEPLDKVLFGAGNQVLELEYASALAALTAAVDALPCGAESATRDQLFRLFFLQGYMHFNENDVEAARAAFTRAAVIDRTKDWPREYPPTAESEYLKGLKAAVDADPARLSAEVETLAHNGESVSVAKPPALLVGDHLLTVNGTPLWVSVAPDAGPVTVTTAGRIAEGILASDAAYAGWLSEACARLGVPELLLLTETGAVLFRDGAFVDPTAGEPEAGGGGDLTPVGAVLAGTGGALLGVGLGLHVSAYGAAGLTEDGGVQASEDEYPGLLARNRAGFGVAVAGGVVLGTGIVMVLVSELSGKSMAVVPFVAPGPDRAAFGLTGRF